MSDEIKVSVVDRGRRFLYLRHVDPVTGKATERSAKTASRAAADKAAGAWEKELQQGASASSIFMTWADFREAYVALHGSSLSDETIGKIDVVFNSFERLVGLRKLNGISGTLAAKWQAKLRAEGKSEHTIASYTAHMKAALQWAVDQEFLPKLPVIRKPKRASVSNAMKGRPITTEEFDRMLDQVDRSMSPIQQSGWKHLLRGLWWSGLRLEESLNLWWDRLDRISIDLSSGRPALWIPAELQKSNQDTLYPVATEFAEMILAVPEEERTGPFFTVLTKAGKPYARRRHQIGKIIADLGRKAGIVVKANPRTGEKDFASAHDLRRSFGERWAGRVEAQYLQQLMRHSSIQTTLRFYTKRDAATLGLRIDEAYRRSVSEAGADRSENRSAEAVSVTLQ